MEGNLQKSWEAVDQFISGKLLGHDPALIAVLGANLVAGLPVIDVSPPLAKLLQLLIRGMGARRVLEIGTLGGYSTIWLARAVPADGRVVTLEIDPGYAEIARSNLARAGVADRVEIVVGAARETLEHMVGDGAEPFDLIFIDADKENNPHYVRLSLQLSRPGTMIVVDNVVGKGRVIDPGATHPFVEGTRQLYDMIEATPGVSATAIQTVGSKGWDGFILALVEER